MSKLPDRLTPRDIHRADLAVAVGCAGCRLIKEINPAALIKAGHGDMDLQMAFLTGRLRCKGCGRAATWMRFAVVDLKSCQDEGLALWLRTSRP